MQAVYRNYYFPVNGVRVSTTTKPLLSDSKIMYGVGVTARISGYLEGVDQVSCSLAENNLREAMKVPYGDFVLLHDDGSVSSTVLNNATSLSGVIVQEGPNFPGEMGNEYVNQRQFNLTLYAEYQLVGSNILTSFRETLSFNGGGPTRVAKLALNGPPQIQSPYKQTAYYAIQSGYAVGLKDYPIIPPALWPFALSESPNIEEESPERMGQGYQKYPIKWTYKFVSATPLIGVPHFWIG